MPYRKTARVVQQLQNRRAAILQSATTLADRGGIDALNVNEVARHADIAIGTLYLHFADRTELIAAIVADRLAQDLAAMTRADNADALADFASAITVYVHRQGATRRLGPALAALPAYRNGIVRELERRIAILLRAERIAAGNLPWLATALYGALNAVAGSKPRLDAKTEQALISMALRLVGAGDLVQDNPLSRRKLAALAAGEL